MSTKREVDSGVPMPGTIRQSTGDAANLDGLQVGDSFHIPAEDVDRFVDAAGEVDLAHAAKAMQSTLYYPSKARGMVVRVRAVPDDKRGPGIRVWRVK